MPVTKVGDININYEIHGEGEPLLLIMGLGGDLTRWFRILPILAKEYMVIIFDNRGAGKSDKPDIAYTMEMMADDAAGLLNNIGIDAAHTFGISLGGMIALNYALRHPGKVLSLILGCTRCGGTHSINDPEGASSALNPELIQVLSPEERARAMMPYLWSQEFIDNNPDVVEQHITSSMENPIDFTGYSRQMGAAATHDTFDRLPEIKLPTLVIAGDADRLIPVENSPIIASGIPGAELVILKGIGHGFYTEARDETGRIVIDFMKRHGVSSRSKR
ncbi:alpha/beta fold hydrolase [Chloroflexota bacterium]